MLGDYATLRLWEAGVVEDFLSRFDEIYQGDPFPCELVDEQRVAIAWIRDLARQWIRSAKTGSRNLPTGGKAAPWGSRSLGRG